MKKTIFALSAALMFVFMISCKGPEGPAGPTGPTGPAGNEEVYLFTYGSKTLESLNGYSADYTFGTLPASKIDESLILIYYSAFSQEWNMANGAGPMAIYQTIQYYSSYDSTAHVYLANGDGSYYSGGDVTWDSSKVYLIPPSMIRAAEKQNVDFSDINAVSRFTGKK
ncbi:MAG: hypothetical protein CVU11_15620 [Bacteroidetes bacterium HGW-Bacteroidetes-6]|jgi:hypothetical protein|nr:MAG: hypothetical protein CVU11_15620 [Bacteroidetes bacterium HGW-Bacteroidetes-6]